MADGGYSGEYAPDSEANPEGPAISYTVAEGAVIEIQKNDWLDVDESLANDPLWGFSRQVFECLPTSLVVKEYNPASDTYEASTLDPSFVWNVFSRKSKTFEGLPETQPQTTQEQINQLSGRCNDLEARVTVLETP